MSDTQRGCRLLVPDGSLEEEVQRLLFEAGIPVYFSGDRQNRGKIRNPDLFPPPFDGVIRMRPQDAVWMVADEKADLAFAGDDLIAEFGYGRDLAAVRRYPISRGGVGETRIVVAVPHDSPIQSIGQITPECELVTEYPSLATRWLQERGVTPRIRLSHGKTEVFGGGIADVIVENTETGNSLTVGGWRIIDEIMRSQLRVFTHGNAGSFMSWLEDEFCLLLDSVINARSYRLIKCNSPAERLEAVLAILPAAGSPTVSQLADKLGFAIESVVLAKQVPGLVTRLRQAGAQAVIDLEMAKYIP
ncbi:MAG: ATP phosphoribosyltransferase [Patescibacteria group bacterium]